MAETYNDVGFDIDHDHRVLRDALPRRIRRFPRGKNVAVIGALPLSQILLLGRLGVGEDGRIAGRPAVQLSCVSTVRLGADGFGVAQGGVAVDGRRRELDVRQHVAPPIDLHLGRRSDQRIIRHCVAFANRPRHLQVRSQDHLSSRGREGNGDSRKRYPRTRNGMLPSRWRDGPSNTRARRLGAGSTRNWRQTPQPKMLEIRN